LARAASFVVAAANMRGWGENLYENSLVPGRNEVESRKRLEAEFRNSNTFVKRTHAIDDVNEDDDVDENSSPPQSRSAKYLTSVPEGEEVAEEEVIEVNTDDELGADWSADGPPSPERLNPDRERSPESDTAVAAEKSSPQSRNRVTAVAAEGVPQSREQSVIKERPTKRAQSSRGKQKRSRSRSPPPQLKPNLERRMGKLDQLDQRDPFECRRGHFKQTSSLMQVNFHRHWETRAAYHHNEYTRSAEREPNPEAAVADVATCSGLCELPLALWGQGNFMIATWVLGKNTSPSEFGEKLALSPFDCIVIVLSIKTGPFAAIATFLSSLGQAPQTAPLSRKEMWKQDMDMVDLRFAIHSEKLVYRLYTKLYVVISKAKVTTVTKTSYQTRSRGLSSVALTTLHMTLHERQNMSEITVGIVYVDGEMSSEHINELVEWIITSRMAILTGYFGNNRQQWSQIAYDARAILDGPFAQWMKVPSDKVSYYGYAGDIDDDGMAIVAHPTCYMFFGYYKTAVAAHATPLAANWVLGQDLFGELIGALDMPVWERNDAGSPVVQGLGTIKMKGIDFERWCHNVIQTCVWIGTSQQGRGAKKRWVERR